MTDRGLPASAYAVPSARLLPLTDENGLPNARQIAAAVGKLKTLPPEHQGTATNRTIAAWRKLHPGKPDSAMPAGLRKAALTPGTISDQTGLFAGLSDVNDDGTVSAMIAFGLPSAVGEAIVLDPSSVADTLTVTPLDQLHCTLAVIDVLPGDMQAALNVIAAAARVAWQTAPFDAELAGPAMFVPDADDADNIDDDPTVTGIYVVLVDAPALPDLFNAVREALDDAGIECEMDHGYIPHVTLARGPVPDLLDLPVPALTDWTVDMLAAQVGGEGGAVQHFPLLGGLAQQSDDDTQPMMMVAKNAAQRVTLAPVYVPGYDDTHGEHVTADDLEKAQWAYMRAKDFDLNLQHIPGTKAGECIGIITWPLPVTCELATGDGTVRKVELPAGTVYMASQWEPPAWDDIQSGRRNGLSLEGSAFRELIRAAAA